MITLHVSFVYARKHKRTAIPDRIYVYYSNTSHSYVAQQRHRHVPAYTKLWISNLIKNALNSFVIFHWLRALHDIFSISFFFFILCGWHGLMCYSYEQQRQNPVVTNIVEILLCVQCAPPCFNNIHKIKNLVIFCIHSYILCCIMPRIYSFTVMQP